MLKGVINSAIQNNAELLKISPTSDATTNPDNIKIGKWAIKKLILSCFATCGFMAFMIFSPSMNTLIKCMTFANNSNQIFQLIQSI